MNESSRGNTPSIRLHKRQLAWQILVPVIAGAVIIIALAVLVITRGTATDRVVADISVMWLIIPVLILLLVFTVVAAGIIFGMSKLMQIIPPFSGKIQSALVALERAIRKLADGSTKPFIWIDETGAAIKRIFRKKK